MLATTTLRKIYSHDPCEGGWDELLVHLGKHVQDDVPLPFSVVLESNGINDAVWCLRTVPEIDLEARRFAIWIAGRVKYLAKTRDYSAALGMAKRFVAGKATPEELANCYRRAMEVLGRTTMLTADHAAGTALVETTLPAHGGHAAYAVKASAAWAKGKDPAFLAMDETKRAEMICCFIREIEDKFIEMFCTETTETEDESK